MGDNAFLGPVVQVVSSASNNLEARLSQVPRGRPSAAAARAAGLAASPFVPIRAHFQV